MSGPVVPGEVYFIQSYKNSNHVLACDDNHYVQTTRNRVQDGWEGWMFEDAGNGVYFIYMNKHRDYVLACDNNGRIQITHNKVKDGWEGWVLEDAGYGAHYIVLNKNRNHVLAVDDRGRVQTTRNRVRDGWEGWNIVRVAENIFPIRYGGFGGDWFSWNHQEPITSIQIRADSYVNGLIINNRYTIGRAGGGSSGTLNLDNNEYISQAEGRWGGLIDRLSFSTNRGRNISAGGGGGSYFHYDASGNKAILIGIDGKSGNSLDQICLIFKKVDPQLREALDAIANGRIQGPVEREKFSWLTKIYSWLHFHSSEEHRITNEAKYLLSHPPEPAQHFQGGRFMMRMAVSHMDISEHGGPSTDITVTHDYALLRVSDAITAISLIGQSLSLCQQITKLEPDFSKVSADVVSKWNNIKNSASTTVKLSNVQISTFSDLTNSSKNLTSGFGTCKNDVQNAVQQHSVGSQLSNSVKQQIETPNITITNQGVTISGANSQLFHLATSDAGALLSQVGPQGLEAAVNTVKELTAKIGANSKKIRDTLADEVNLLLSLYQIQDDFLTYTYRVLFYSSLAQTLADLSGRMKDICTSYTSRVQLGTNGFVERIHRQINDTTDKIRQSQNFSVSFSQVQQFVNEVNNLAETRKNYVRSVVSKIDRSICGLDDLVDPPAISNRTGNVQRMLSNIHYVQNGSDLLSQCSSVLNRDAQSLISSFPRRSPSGDFDFGLIWDQAMWDIQAMKFANSTKPLIDALSQKEGQARYLLQSHQSNATDASRKYETAKREFSQKQQANEITINPIIDQIKKDVDAKTVAQRYVDDTTKQWGHDAKDVKNTIVLLSSIVGLSQSIINTTTNTSAFCEGLQLVNKNITSALSLLNEGIRSVAPASGSPSDVKNWLDRNGFSEFSQTFYNHGINQQKLMQLTDQDLINLGMSKVLQRRSLLSSRYRMGNVSENQIPDGTKKISLALDQLSVQVDKISTLQTLTSSLQSVQQAK